MQHPVPIAPRRLTLEIDGMSCGHCVAAVSAALKELPGVVLEQLSVGSATLSLDAAAAATGTITDAALRAVREAGYEARVAEGDAPVPITRACCGARP
jgi:copper chaperone CopZ